MTPRSRFSIDAHNLVLAVCLLAFVISSVSAEVGAPLSRRELANEPIVTVAGRSYELHVKFHDALKMRVVAGGNVSSLAGAANQRVMQIASANNILFEPLIKLSDEKIDKLEKRAEQKSGVSQPDLRGMMIARIPSANTTELVRVAELLRSLPEVEFAHLSELNPPPPIDYPPTTPNYVPFQDYRSANPGLNVDYLWVRGGKGQGIRYSDCEYGWDVTHEDLVDVPLVVEAGQTMDSPFGNDHGTSAVGITAGKENGYGITGIAPNVESVNVYPEISIQQGSRRVTCIANAIADSDPGDIVLLEMQTGGITNYAPAEYDMSVWTVVKNGGDQGVIVVAAAGNGAQNLDIPGYAPYMNRGDSKSIIIGAGSANTGHNTLGFSTYGSRVNVQTWGESVFTSGYGDFVTLGGDDRQTYTDGFNGTSSASAVAAGSISALQSYALLVLGRPLTPMEMRQVLIATGYPQGSGGHIGPCINLGDASIYLDEFLVNPTDTDSDGVADVLDNCPSAANANQNDYDLDGLGDACDPDADADGILNASDNCDFLPNADQLNSDTDNYGDACDNCDLVDNDNQYDENADGLGDACDGFLHIQNYAFPDGYLNQPYFIQLEAIGGTPPYHWSMLGGDLPFGCNFNGGTTGTISGTPGFAATYFFTFMCSDSDEFFKADTISVSIDVIEPPYLCGDADNNELVNISDAVYLIAYIFSGGPAPNPIESGDADCSGLVNISDVVYLIAYIFSGGPQPCSACG